MPLAYLPEPQPEPGKTRVIDPILSRTMVFANLLTSPLLALVLPMTRDGMRDLTRDPFVIDLNDGEAEVLLEGTLWISAKDGSVLQNKGIINKEQAKIYLDGGKIQGPRPALLVSDFHKGGILALQRAMQHAAAKIKNKYEKFVFLTTLSDDALGYALDVNLRDPVNMKQHRANLVALKAIADQSGSKLADEINTFLEKLGSAHDKLARYNTRRMILIVRAVQRRSVDVAQHQLATLEVVNGGFKAVTAYIANVRTLASRIASVLADDAAWWRSGSVLYSPKSKRRLGTLIERLTAYEGLLRKIMAKPLRGWAHAGAEYLKSMRTGIEEGVITSTVIKYAYRAQLCMEAIEMQCQISQRIYAMSQSTATSKPPNLLQFFQSAPEEWQQFTRVCLALTGALEADGDWWWNNTNLLHEMEEGLNVLGGEVAQLVTKIA